MSKIVDLHSIPAERTPEEGFWTPTLRQMHEAIGRFLAEGHGDRPVLVAHIPYGAHGVQAFARLALCVGHLGGTDEAVLAITVRDEDRV